MKDVLTLAVHLLTTIAKLIGPGGARAVVADSLLMKQQLLVMSRTRQRAPSLSALDRSLFGFRALFLHPRRTMQSAANLPVFSACARHVAGRMADQSGFRPKPEATGISRWSILSRPLGRCQVSRVQSLSAAASETTLATPITAAPMAMPVSRSRRSSRSLR